MKRSDPFSGREQRSASPQPVQMSRRQTLHPERCNGNWFLDTRVPVMVTARKVRCSYLRRAVTPCWNIMVEGEAGELLQWTPEHMGRGREAFCRGQWALRLLTMALRARGSPHVPQ